MQSLEPKLQKYTGRVELRRDIVKDNSGDYAVFTEQGSSASQMTAAKIMDVIASLPGCERQTADAVSAYTQVVLQNHSKFQSQSVQMFGYVFHDTNGEKSWEKLRTPWYFLNKIYTGTP